MVGNITRRGTPTFLCRGPFLAQYPTLLIFLTSAEQPSWRSPLSFLVLLLTPWSPEEKAGIERSQWFRTKGLGYVAEQSTQPQTLGYSLADSPVGLLAWIYEKLVLWTDDYKWTDDEGTRMLTYSVYYSPALKQC